MGGTSPLRRRVGKLDMMVARRNRSAAPADTPPAMPPGFENLTTSARLAELVKRRAELKAHETGAALGIGVAVPA